MRYLVTTLITTPFLCNHYEYENHWNSNPNINMVVYDLALLKYTENGVDWIQLNVDHL